MNVAEGLYAVATVLIFIRMSHILAANETLGPLQRSLRRMIVVCMIHGLWNSQTCLLYPKRQKIKKERKKRKFSYIL